MTDRRVTLSLMFTTDEDAGTLLTRVLAQLDPADTAALAATNTYAYDPTDHTDETRAHMVLSPSDGVMKIHIDDEDTATNHAKAIDGVLIELPVIEDFRTVRTPKES